MWKAFLISFLGLWLAVAPFITMDIPSVQINNALIGSIVIFASLYMPCKKGRRYLPRWFALILGIWIFFVGAIPWFADGTPYQWNNIITGMLIVFSGMAIVDIERARKES